MDERILCLLQTLAEVERELGGAVYDSAIERARLAVAAEVMVEAERRALRSRPRRGPGNVVYLRGTDKPDGGCDANR
ncbi:hypothetical protein [Methylobacterium sp. J-070]|uniref:hypothetical protein n=1 Tax=Methylobacterium sp. J-070 TaxID=2836650 RepID=UPI001FB8F869|nr:hypothetical protein [Methylobacterium sp. J-070]MCJ2054517.1 hypothetical protein [Methylobacterium sp. J-070]